MSLKFHIFSWYFTSLFLPHFKILLKFWSELSQFLSIFRNFINIFLKISTNFVKIFQNIFLIIFWIFNQEFSKVINFGKNVKKTAQKTEKYWTYFGKILIKIYEEFGLNFGNIQTNIKENNKRVL